MTCSVIKLHSDCFAIIPVRVQWTIKILAPTKFDLLNNPLCTAFAWPFPFGQTSTTISMFCMVAHSKLKVLDTLPCERSSLQSTHFKFAPWKNRSTYSLIGIFCKWNWFNISISSPCELDNEKSERYFKFKKIPGKNNFLID